MGDSIGDRMKENYENCYRIKLTRRMPVIIRLDGKAFHTLTRKCDKPFDKSFITVMGLTAQKLCKEIQGAKCAYVQSDEISILITDFDTIRTGAWFDYCLQKMVSVSAGIASSYFNFYIEANSDFCKWQSYKPEVMDSRAFNIPKDEVCNYFIWRQKDWIRNSLQMLARVHFSHKELHKKNSSDIHEMLHQKGVNWSDLPDHQKNGIFLEKEIDFWPYGSPIFTKEREVIEKYLIEGGNENGLE